MKLIIDIPDDDYSAVRCEALYYIGHDRLARSVTTAFQTAVPYEERPQKEWVEFADFVARNVVSEDFDEDVGFYAEVLCRKLVKLGLVKLDGDTYKYCGAKMKGEEE